MARKGPSPKQLAARQRFAEMARAAAAAKRGRAGVTGKLTTGGLPGMLGLALQALTTAAWVEAGKVGSRAVGNAVVKVAKIETPEGITGMLLAHGVQLAGGFGVSLLVQRFVGAKEADNVLAGVMLGILESQVRRLNVPYISELMGDEGDPAMSAFTYALYPERLPDAELARLAAGPAAGMALYPGQPLSAYYEQ